MDKFFIFLFSFHRDEIIVEFNACHPAMFVYKTNYVSLQAMPINNFIIC